MEVREVAADDETALALVAAYVDELRERLGAFEGPSIDLVRADGANGVTLVLFEEGVGVACGSLRVLDATTAEVKRMFVAPRARGRGHARSILRLLEAKARSLGCRRVVLDTAAPLHEAVALYLREGFSAIAPYNDNPYAAHWFEKRLL